MLQNTIPWVIQQNEGTQERRDSEKAEYPRTQNALLYQASLSQNEIAIINRQNKEKHWKSWWNNDLASLNYWHIGTVIIIIIIVNIILFVTI